mmetsp:Transcript_7620/g.15636  ORF Transcript_7620/g.15636 Transcript_7620/m.15636 type:complete len:317 (-) Transcript_7620:917-1867(-)
MHCSSDAFCLSLLLLLLWIAIAVVPARIPNWPTTLLLPAPRRPFPPRQSTCLPHRPPTTGVPFWPKNRPSRPRGTSPMRPIRHDECDANPWAADGSITADGSCHHRRGVDKDAESIWTTIVCATTTDPSPDDNAFEVTSRTRLAILDGPWATACGPPPRHLPTKSPVRLEYLAGLPNWFQWTNRSGQWPRGDVSHPSLERASWRLTNDERWHPVRAAVPWWIPSRRNQNRGASPRQDDDPRPNAPTCPSDQCTRGRQWKTRPGECIRVCDVWTWKCWGVVMMMNVVWLWLWWCAMLIHCWCHHHHRHHLPLLHLGR